MKIDGPLYAQLGDAAAEARRMAGIGYDGLYTLEGSSDPFYPLVLAAEHAPGLDLATAIAVAFPRNPMHLAYQAWDLQAFSAGRFSLGIGSQVKAHIENRFGVAFSHPAARMREYILALRAIFDCWQNGSRLDFRGDYFTHTLMTPMFNPGPNPFGPPGVMLGALGPKMTEVAGEVADGLIVHPFNNLTYLSNHAIPAVRRGLAASSRAREEFTVQINAMVITGETAEAMAAATASVRNLLGFYASTPAYRAPMEAVGYGGLQPELNRLAKASRWAEMGAVIDQGFLDAFVTSGEPKDIAGKLSARYADHADRLAIYAPYTAPDNLWRGIIADLKNS